jgi:hypothetical protein
VNPARRFGWVRRVCRGLNTALTGSPDPKIRASLRDCAAFRTRDSLSGARQQPGSWCLPRCSSFVGLLLGIGYFAFQYSAGWQLPWLEEQASRIGTGFFSVVVAVLLSLLLAPLLSVPIMERLVVEQEQALGLPARESVGFWDQWVVSFSSQALALLVVVPLALALVLGSLIFTPLLLPLTSPIGGALVTWSLLDFPMTLHGLRWQERIALLRRYPRCSLGFAVGCGLVNLLPLSWLFILPLGAVAATRCLATLNGALRPAARR